jgi:prepilin-type N-terminal cleavage/methylation domain-containing protein
MKNSAGFTLVELVITIVLVGILAFTTIPTYNLLINNSQSQINISNMHIIRDTFIQYHYDSDLDGFPTEPENSLLDSTYRETILSDGRTPDMLFSGDLPYNTNNNPYTYYIENDTSEHGWVTNRMIVTDLDPDSPSYEEYVIGEL